jgi:pyruvate dehydrogenase E1 component alpha subunit
MNKHKITKIVDDALKIRKFQLQINQLMLDKKIAIPIHLSLGSELLISAILSHRENIAGIFSTHRNIAFNLYYSQNVNEYLNFLDNPENKLASMNSSGFNDVIKYSSSILGNNLSIAAGFALAEKLKGGEGKIVIADTGDGAIEEGVFWETLIMSRHFDLPILILVQDNNQSMYTNVNERRKNISLELVADAHECNYIRIRNKKNTTIELVEKAVTLAEFRPTILHTDLPVFNHHHGPTPGFLGDEKNLISDAQGLMTEMNLNEYIDPLKRLVDFVNSSK